MAFCHDHMNESPEMFSRDSWSQPIATRPEASPRCEGLTWPRGSLEGREVGRAFGRRETQHSLAVAFQEDDGPACGSRRSKRNAHHSVKVRCERRGNAVNPHMRTLLQLFRAYEVQGSSPAHGVRAASRCGTFSVDSGMRQRRLDAAVAPSRVPSLNHGRGPVGPTRPAAPFRDAHAKA